MNWTAFIVSATIGGIVGHTLARLRLGLFPLLLWVVAQSLAVALLFHWVKWVK